MKTAIISFTGTGYALSLRIGEWCREHGFEAEVFVKSAYVEAPAEALVQEPVRQWVQGRWEQTQALIFVGAAGIAVRAVSPFVKSKKEDPAVLCLDEQGRFCIPLLSGHLGGANELACSLSRNMGSIPVITTATDINDCFAVDLFAKEQGMHIKNMAEAKELSAALLAGEKLLTVGVGCRKGTSFGEIEQAIVTVCGENKIPTESIRQIVSIDLKKNEPGLLEFARRYEIPFFTYTGEELKSLPGTYTPSLFVESVTGVDNVCERSAVLGSGGGILIQRKSGRGRVTVALAIENGRKTDE